MSVAQGVCRQLSPLMWFVQLPLYPSNMRDWLGTTAPAQPDESQRDRELRILPVLRQLLQGLDYLHRVRAASFVAA